MAENIFDKVSENVDIVDVVSRFVDLIPKGKNLFGLCPFHDDHTPKNFSVSKERNLWYCFACHEGGGAIKFIEKYKHMSSIEACKFLADEYHIDVSEFDTSYIDTNKKYYDIMGASQRFYQLLMKDANYSLEAREYLKNRGITEEVISEFQIGLSSKNKDDLIKQLFNKGFLSADIKACSLSNGDTDFFIDRIMVPIRDEQGRTVAFGGRIYKNLENINKYQNSTETPIFKKGEIVFNLDRAIRHLKETDYLILNEGYMDVIQSYSKGIKNVVAIMGTQLTDDQATLIAKYTKNVAVCLDGDEAGIKGTKGVVEKLNSKGINTSITILNDGMDPDEFLRKYGKDLYLKKITRERLDKISYLYELTKLDYKEINSFNIESYKKSIFDKIKNEKENTVIETFLKRLSNELNLSYESISQDFKEYNNAFNKRNKFTEPIISSDKSAFNIEGALKKAEKMVIDYALTDKKYFDEIELIMESRVFINDSDYRTLFIEIGDIYDINPKIESFDLITELKYRNVYKDFSYDTLLEYSINDLRNNVLSFIKKNEIKEMIEYKKKKMISTDTSKEEKINLQKEIIKLNKELRNYGSK